MERAMKRARPIASLIRERGYAQVRLGGGWPAPFAKADRYRAQVSRFGASAELTRIAFLLEALPSTRCKGISFLAMAGNVKARRWADRTADRARRMGFPVMVEMIANPYGGVLAVVVGNRGVKPRKEAAHYDRVLAKRDARFAAKRERTKASQWAKAASDGAEWAWWQDQQESHESEAP